MEFEICIPGLEKSWKLEKCVWVMEKSYKIFFSSFCVNPSNTELPYVYQTLPLRQFVVTEKVVEGHLK